MSDRMRDLGAPAEKLGIKVMGDDKWMTLIQNACNPTNLDSESEAAKQTQTTEFCTRLFIVFIYHRAIKHKNAPDKGHRQH